MAAGDHSVVAQLARIADELVRQNEIMERDVDAEMPMDIATAVRNTAHNIANAYIEYINTDLTEKLDDLITRSYANDMARAVAIRTFQRELSEFEGLNV